MTKVDKVLIVTFFSTVWPSTDDEGAMVSVKVLCGAGEGFVLGMVLFRKLTISTTVS